MFLFRLQFQYGETWGPVRGGTTGSMLEVSLDDNTFIDTIAIAQGYVMDLIEFYAQDGSSLGVHGNQATGGVIQKGRGFLYLKGKTGTFMSQTVFCDISLFYLYEN